MRNRTLLLSLVGLPSLGLLLLSAGGQNQRPGSAIAATRDLRGQMPPGFNQDVAKVVADIDRIETDTLGQMGRTTLDRDGQIHTLGKLMLFDKHLSVNQNEACSFCHTPETGFTGPIQSLNLSTVSYPGSVRTRFSQRKPQSYMYATFAPVLHYNPLQGDLVGGNFWDMRASGYRLQSPSAEQAQGPPTNPVEMGLPDSACVAYRLSKTPYRKLFETVWVADSFAIQWPADVEKVCSTPGPPPREDPYPVHLGVADRQRADRVYDGFGLAVAAYEASPEVSPFTSKYDYVQAGKEEFTPQEEGGMHCSAARPDATSVTAMAGPVKSRCSRTSQAAISEYRGIQTSSITTKISPTTAAMVLICRDKPSSTSASDPFYARCKAIAVN